MTLEMRPRFVVGVFGEPGDYRATFMPTRPGTYTFHFTGAIDGTEIEESFTSGPDTFNDVDDPAEISFPVQDPSTAELSERIERDTARMEEALQAGEGDADTAQTLGLIGIILGAAGLVTAGTLGGLALRKR